MCSLYYTNLTGHFRQPGNSAYRSHASSTDLDVVAAQWTLHWSSASLGVYCILDRRMWGEEANLMLYV
jgi:hypothetical protein